MSDKLSQVVFLRLLAFPCKEVTILLKDATGRSIVKQNSVPPHTRHLLSRKSGLILIRITIYATSCLIQDLRRQPSIPQDFPLRQKQPPEPKTSGHRELSETQ